MMKGPSVLPLMDPKSLPYAMVGGLLAVAAMLSIAVAQFAEMRTHLRVVLERKIQPMQTLIETVTTSDGRKITVTTVRIDGETVEAFLARHDAVVQAVQNQ